MTQPTNAQRLVRVLFQIRHLKTGKASRAMSELGISASHIRVLYTLAHTDKAIPMKELASALDLTPPSITSLIRRLDEAGLITRTADTSDSRVALIALTDEGQALLRAFYEQQVSHMDALLSTLSDDEQAQVLRLLERAAAALTDASESAGEHCPARRSS